MIYKKLFGFVCGLQFALIQFGIFLLLQINVSSTYITYALVTICWMVGVIFGIWSNKASPFKLILLQILSYYFVYLIVGVAPFSVATLPIASLAIMMAGLWAGRFFVVLLAGMKKADSLFFHENNGFTVGIALFFAGFTLFGRDFLLIAPFVTFLLMILIVWREAKGQVLVIEEVPTE